MNWKIKQWKLPNMKNREIINQKKRKKKRTGPGYLWDYDKRVVSFQEEKSNRAGLKKVFEDFFTEVQNSSMGEGSHFTKWSWDDKTFIG